MYLSKNNLYIITNKVKLILILKKMKILIKKNIKYLQI